MGQATEVDSGRAAGWSGSTPAASGRAPATSTSDRPGSVPVSVPDRLVLEMSWVWST